MYSLDLIYTNINSTLITHRFLCEKRIAEVEYLTCQLEIAVHDVYSTSYSLSPCLTFLLHNHPSVFYRSRRQQEIEAAGLENPALMSELRALRQRKDELETHLATLQDSRKQLMHQLEGLMKMLKVLTLDYS